jgi:hypothetical protein
MFLINGITCQLARISVKPEKLALLALREGNLYHKAIKVEDSNKVTADDLYDLTDGDSYSVIAESFDEWLKSQVTQ